MKFNFTALKPDGSVFYSEEDLSEDHPISRLMYLMNLMCGHLTSGSVTHIIIETVKGKLP